jgi:multiple sugar transport system substrate-binding protein
MNRRELLQRSAALAGPGALWPLTACGRGAGSGTQGQPAGELAPPARIRRGAKVVWAVDEGPTRTPLRQDQVQLFQAQFPDVEVELLAGGASDMEKLQTAFAAGTPPDLFRQETPGFAFFASRGQIAPLDALMKRDKYDLADFFPAAWELWRWKERYFGVPFLGIRIAYFNRDLVRQAGASMPPASWKDPAWTWTTFLETCRTVRHAAGNRWACDLVSGTTRRDWQPWVWSNGGALFNQDGTKVLLAEPPAVEALEFLVDLVHRHRVAPTADELQAMGGRRALFQAGNLFLYHEPVNSIAANRRGASFDWSLTGLPRGKGKTAVASGGGVGWFLAAPSTVKDETWELMKVLASKDGVRLEALRGEAPPSRRSVAAEPAFSNPSEPPGPDMKVVIEALEQMGLEPPLIEGVEIDRLLGEALGPAFQGQKPVREAVAQAVPRIQPLLNPA